ncbi:MAG: hypothetical protein ACRDYA_13570 [Egibacteraceae bacterium]
MHRERVPLDERLGESAAEVSGRRPRTVAGAFVVQPRSLHSGAATTTAVTPPAPGRPEGPARAMPRSQPAIVPG